MDEENQVQRYEPVPRALEKRPPALPASAETVEMEEAPDLLAYWRVIRKRRWTILTVFFVLFSLVLLGTLKQKPVYRARALLEIEKENPHILTVQELFELEGVSDTYLETQYKILQSTSLARRVIEELNLTAVAEFTPPDFWSFWKEKSRVAKQSFRVGAPTASEADAETYQKTLDNFMDRLEVEPIKNSRLVEISFESWDPELAARVVNTLASSYIEQNLEVRWQATQKASEWLSQQLLGLKIRLERSEDELQQYAREEGLLFLENKEGNPENMINERLRQLQEELTKAEAVRFEKESLYQLVQNGQYASLPGVFENKLMQDLTVRLAELKREHAQLMTTFAPAYPRVKQVQSQIEELERVLGRERQRAAERITNDYLAARRRESLLRQALEKEKDRANRIAERSVQYNILKREVDTNKQLYEGLLGRLREAGVSAGLKASNIRIVDAAVPPQKPAKPKLVLNLALGLVLGLGLGVGTAFLQEYFDNTLKTSEDVERFLCIPALALIPSADSLNHRGGSVHVLYDGNRLLASAQGDRAAASSDGPEADSGAVRVRGQWYWQKFWPKRFEKKDGRRAARGEHWYRIDGDGYQHSALSEAFRSLRTSVLLATAERPPRSLLVSSSQPGEGKTTVSVNLAISLAQLGRRVFLVDGDMRRPALHKVFGLKESAGLVGYLTGQQGWRAALQPARVTGLDVLVCGPVPPNPAELVSSERMRSLMGEAMADYDFVVVDSPPLLTVADSRILATVVEGVVLVIEGGVTPRELAQRAQAYARDVGSNVIGVVLNNLDLRADAYYYRRYYRYDYYYKHPEAEEGESGKQLWDL